MNFQNKNYNGMIQATLKINGAAHDLQIEPRVSRLDAWREFAGLELSIRRSPNITFP